MNSGKTTVPTGPRKSWRRFALAIFALLLLLTALAIGAALFLVPRPSSTEPPAVDLGGADPALVQAVETLRKEVQEKPRSARAWGTLGMLLAAHRLNPEAATCFARAAARDAHDPRWPYLHGCMVLETAPEQAGALFEQAVAVGGPWTGVAELRLAEVFLEQGRLDESQAHFQRVLVKDPETPWAHFGLGRVACEREHWAESVPPLQRAAASRFTGKAAQVLLAGVYQRLGDSAAAAAALAAAAQLSPDLPRPDPFLREVQALQVGRDAHRARINELLEQGRGDEALAASQEAQRTYPDLYWLIEGRRFLDQGNLPAAEQALRQAVELAPDSAQGHYSLGMALLRQEKWSAAEASFRAASERDPTNGPALLGLARCLRQQGQRSAATQACRAAVNHMPLDAAAHRELGALLAEGDQLAEAQTQLRQAVQLDPADEVARTLLEQVIRRRTPGDTP
jgi:tetratricopeptide (TPR) repeat protein